MSEAIVQYPMECVDSYISYNSWIRVSCLLLTDHVTFWLLPLLLVNIHFLFPLMLEIAFKISIRVTLLLFSSYPANKNLVVVSDPSKSAYKPLFLWTEIQSLQSCSRPYDKDVNFASIFMLWQICGWKEGSCLLFSLGSRFWWNPSLCLLNDGYLENRQSASFWRPQIWILLLLYCFWIEHKMVKLSK